MSKPSTLPELRARYGERYRWLLLLGVMVGSVASIMSSTIINVAVPDMRRHFVIGQERAQWVSSGFMVAMTVSMLTTPWLLGRFGYRRNYEGSMWLLMAGGVLGGLALAGTIAVVGRLTNRCSTHVLVSIGLGLLALSFVMVFAIDLHTSLWAVTMLVVLGRVGLGFILPSLNLGAMRSLPRELIPQGASAINFARTLGGATGVSLCGIVLEWRLAAHGDSLVVVASSAARLAAFNESFSMLAALCLLALLAARQLRDPAPSP